MGYSWREAEDTRQLWRFSSKSEVEALRLGAFFKIFILLQLRKISSYVVITCVWNVIFMAESLLADNSW